MAKQHLSSVRNQKNISFLFLGHSALDYEFSSIQTMQTLPSIVSSLLNQSMVASATVKMCTDWQCEIISVQRVILTTCDPFCRRSKEQGSIEPQKFAWYDCMKCRFVVQKKGLVGIGEVHQAMIWSCSLWSAPDVSRHHDLFLMYTCNLLLPF